jgi:hypothetical protein
MYVATLGIVLLVVLICLALIRIVQQFRTITIIKEPFEEEKSKAEQIAAMAELSKLLSSKYDINIKQTTEFKKNVRMNTVGEDGPNSMRFAADLENQGTNANEINVANDNLNIYGFKRSDGMKYVKLHDKMDTDEVLVGGQRVLNTVVGANDTLQFANDGNKWKRVDVSADVHLLGKDIYASKFCTNPTSCITQEKMNDIDKIRALETGLGNANNNIQTIQEAGVSKIGPMEGRLDTIDGKLTAIEGKVNAQVKGDQLCIGKTCITEQQLQQIAQQSATRVQQSARQNAGSARIEAARQKICAEQCRPRLAGLACRRRKRSAKC